MNVFYTFLYVMTNAGSIASTVRAVTATIAWCMLLIGCLVGRLLPD